MAQSDGQADSISTASPGLRPDDGLCGGYSNKIDSDHYFSLADDTGATEVFSNQH
jgi:hypothetical protein